LTFPIEPTSTELNTSAFNWRKVLVFGPVSELIIKSDFISGSVSATAEGAGVKFLLPEFPSFKSLIWV